MTQQEIQREALRRAESQQTLSNYPLIYEGFIRKGIPESEISPRENVFTYNAWKAKGRQVRRGEHGVKVRTIRTVKDKKDPERTRSLPWMATVFHVSQTDPIKN